MAPDDKPKPDDSKKKAAAEEIDFAAIRPHLTRDAVIVISQDLDIDQVASQMAADDKAAIQAAIQAGRISKPSLQQLELWSKDPSIRFLMVIVQPFVVIQPKLN